MNALRLGEELRSPFVDGAELERPAGSRWEETVAGPGITQEPWRPEESWADPADEERGDDEDCVADDGAGEDPAALLEAEASGVPRGVGVAFAPEAPAGSFFPVRSSHPRGAEITYVTQAGNVVGQDATRRFGASRNNGARRHAAVDLYANRGDEVAACEDGRIVAFYQFNGPRAWALLIEHPGVVVNYGEVDPASLRRLGLAKGDAVRAGQTIAYVGVNPRGSTMLHFETYRPGTHRNLRWPGGGAAPQALLDPTRYLLALLPSFAPRSGTTPGGTGMPSGRPELRRGSSGDHVRALQAALTGAGFPTTVDGDFGRLTLASVRAFQSAHGLAVDGIVGPLTWQALDAAAARGSGTSGVEATEPSGSGRSGPLAQGLAVLRAAVPDRVPFSYQFTTEDLIWSAKLLVHEAGGRDDVENRAVLWAMFNRYALFTHTVYPTFTAFIRAYSTTLQKVLRSQKAAERHYRKGDAVYRRTGGFYPGSNVPCGQLVRHLRIQAAPWEEVLPSARDVAIRALRGEVPNPGIGLASEFASTWVFYRQRHGAAPTREQWEAYTRDFARRRSLEWIPLPGVAPQRNVFFVQRRVAALPSTTVTVSPPAAHDQEVETWYEGPADWGCDPDTEAWEQEREWDARLDEADLPAEQTWTPGSVPPAATVSVPETDVLPEAFEGTARLLEGEATTCTPASEPDPDGVGPQPLLKRWGGKRHSHRPAVGLAQQHLNAWLARQAAGTTTCVATPGTEAYVAARIAELRALHQLPLDVDCHFAQATQAATRAFQACQGLKRDGRIGPDTWPRLLTFTPSGGISPPTPSGALGALTARYLPPPGGADVAPVTTRTHVEPIVDGRDYFARIQAQAAALKAGDAWYVTGWVFDPGFTFSGGTTVQDLLLDAVAAGVDVRVILWANRQMVDNPGLVRAFRAGPYRRVVTSNISAAETLRGATRGGGAPPLARRVLLDWSGNAASSHHMKINYFSHDGADIAFVGGIDYDQLRLDAPEHRPSGPHPWHDAGVRVDGEAACRVLETVVSRWTEASTLSAATYDIGGGPKPYNPSSPAALFPPPSGSTVPVPASTDTAVQVVRSVPDSKEFGLLRNKPWSTLPTSGIHEVLTTFSSVLRAAQRYVYIEDQTFNAEHSLFPLLADCCRRGVKVIAVLTGLGDPLDAPGTVPPSLSDAVVTGIVDRLTASQQQNLAVWHLDGIIVHAKLVLVDDAVMSIGSANFMDRSMEFTPRGDDSECSAVMVTTGTAVADLRVRLWAEHLRVSAATAGAELRDLTKSLGFWRPAWGTGLGFAHSDSRLVFVGPTLPAPALAPTPAPAASSSS